MPSTTNLPAPSSWSKETQEAYVPIKSLGVGGFGSVWLAKEKSNTSSTSSTLEEHTNTHDQEKDQLVAIKVVGHPHNQKISSRLQISEEGYFHREVSILQEISHPMIVKCFKVFEDHDPKSS